MTDKEKISQLSLCLGVCMGFIARHGLMSELKEEYAPILDAMDKIVYGDREKDNG